MSTNRLDKYVYVLYVIFELDYFSTLHKDTQLLTPLFTCPFSFFPVVHVPQLCISQHLIKIVSSEVLACVF